MSATSYLSPALHIEETLSPFARRLTDILRKECERRRYLEAPVHFFIPLLYPIQNFVAQTYADAFTRRLTTAYSAAKTLRGP
jgi:hypothetical protein